jgi:release factor glutamine methyltransferase
VKELIEHITAQMLPCYPEDEARSLAWWIVEEETGLSRSQLLIGDKININFSNVQEIIERILHFEPIQYIFGHTLWYGLDLKVTPATLIPRPETAELVKNISNHFKQLQTTSNFRVLDVGTGSGCIAIALKKAHPEWEVTGIDISPEAIEIARENARRNNVEVNFEVADIFNFQLSIINYQFDIVVSNPPYICESEKADMRPNVLNFEPATALFVPDNDPLKFYRKIAQLFARTLYTIHHTPKYLFFEINEAYPAELSAMLDQLGYTDIRITKDIYGKPRIIEARMA